MHRLAILIIATTFGGELVRAQPPGQEPPTPTAPRTLELPPAEFPAPIEPEPDPDAAQKIEQTLRGDDIPAAPGVLGDVLQMLRSQGSVLDGSVLDPRSDDAELLPSEPSAGSTDAPGLHQSTQFRHQNVEAAEALLRAARMLESLPRDSEQPAKGSGNLLPIDRLVHQMRMRATRLLIAEFPDASECSQNPLKQ